MYFLEMPWFDFNLAFSIQFLDKYVSPQGTNWFI